MLHSEVKSDFLHDPRGTDFIRAVGFPSHQNKQERGIYTEEGDPLKEESETLAGSRLSLPHLQLSHPGFCAVSSTEPSITRFFFFQDDKVLLGVTGNFRLFLLSFFLVIPLLGQSLQVFCCSASGSMGSNESQTPSPWLRCDEPPGVNRTMQSIAGVPEWWGPMWGAGEPKLPPRWVVRAEPGLT